MAGKLILEDGGDRRFHRERLEALVNSSDGPIRIATAYVTDRLLLTLSKCERRLLIPLRPIDVAAGATSIETIRALIEDGVHCRFLPHHPRFHAKTYVFGAATAIVTSANLTISALNSNVEVGTELTGKSVSSLVSWFDDLWCLADPLTSDHLSKVADQAKALRRDYEKLRRKANTRVPFFPKTDVEAPRASSIEKLFQNAERFFLCNTNRRYTERTPTGGFVTEEAMHTRGFATAWESFNFNAHMEEVREGDGILMFAKDVGIIGVGVATGPCETLQVGDSARVFDSETPEWRVPTEWLAWVDDHAALPYKSSNYTFANVSGDNYSTLLDDALEHFTSFGDVG